MKLGLERFIKDTNPSFEFNWHHIVQCNLVDEWLMNNIKNLLILAPPRSSKTELISRMLPVYLDNILSKNQSVLHLTYSSSLSDKLKRNYYKTCGRSINNPYESIVKFSGVGCSLSSRFNYIIMDDLIKSMQDACSKKYMEALHKWYDCEVLTRLTHDGKQIMISSHYPNDLASKIMKSDNPNWTIIKFPFISEIESDYRPAGKVLWERMLSIGQVEKDIEIQLGKPYFITLYQQEDPMPSIRIY